MNGSRKHGYRWLMSVGVLLLCGLSAPLYGQTSTVTVGQAFTLAWDHDGQNTAGYRLFLDNVQVAEIPVSALTAGTARATNLTVATRGTHLFEVAAYNADRESTRAGLTVTGVLPTPSTPTNLQIVITMALNPDGSISVRWAQAQ